MVEQPRGDVRRGFQRSAHQDFRACQPPRFAVWSADWAPPDRPAARRRPRGRVRGPPRPRRLRRARLPARPDRARRVPARPRRRPRRRGRVPGRVPRPRPQGEDGPPARRGRRVALRRGGADGEQGEGGRGPAAEAGDDRGVSQASPDARSAGDTGKLPSCSPPSTRNSRKLPEHAARGGRAVRPARQDARGSGGRTRLPRGHGRGRGCTAPARDSADALARRGLALPAAGLATMLVPAPVSRCRLSARPSPPRSGSASPAVLALAREVTRSMAATTIALALGVITLVAGGLLAAGSMWPSDEPERHRARRSCRKRS